MSGMRTVGLWALVCVGFNSRAEADFHLMRISELMAQAGGDPRIQFVELQTTDPGQHLVAGHHVDFFDAAGMKTGQVTFSDDVTDSAANARILIGTQKFADVFGVVPDLILPEGLMAPYSGRVCFEDIDCVAYGAFTGANTGYGTPAPAFPVNGVESLTLIHAMSPFPPKDNTADFAFRAPSPTKNGGTPVPAPAGLIECFVTDDFADLGQWDVPEANAGLDLTNCGAPAVVDIGSVTASGNKLIITPGAEDQLGLGFPIGITGLSSQTAEEISDASYRLKLDLLGRAGITDGAVFVRQRYFFDPGTKTLDVSEAAGIGINFGFDDVGEITDHLHADVRLVCLQEGSVDGEDEVDFPGFKLLTGQRFTVVIDVDGDDENGPLTYQVKFYPADQPEDPDYLATYQVSLGLGPLGSDELVHAILIAGLGADTAALEISSFSVCAIPRNQKHVRDLTCERQDDGTIEVAWQNPYDAESSSIRVLVNGEPAATLPGDATSYTVDGPPDGEVRISVVNYSGVAEECTVCENNPPVPVITGPSQVPDVGVVTLDSASSTDGDDGTQTLSRFWEIIEAPPDAAASIQDAGAVQVRISVNAEGPYRIRLTLTDSGCPGSPGVSAIDEHSFEVGHIDRLQRPGDENEDGRLDITDPVELLNHLFIGTNPTLPCGDGTIGDAANLMLLDLNGDGRIDIADAVFGLNFLFSGGDPPVQGTDCIPIAGCPSNECRD